MKHMGGLLLVMMFLTSCGQNVPDDMRGQDPQAPKPSPDATAVSGELGVFNDSQNDIYSTVTFGQISHSPGFVGKGKWKVMGFASLMVGTDIKVGWREDMDDGSERNSEVQFDGSQLEDVAGEARGFKFTYLGERRWRLDVYRASHMQNGDLIKTISAEAAQRNEQSERARTEAFDGGSESVRPE